jgi:asparagine synthase (glutamine-hydrolysing)
MEPYTNSAIPGPSTVWRILHAEPDRIQGDCVAGERSTRPIRSPEGHLLVWDGRLDNRPDLRTAVRSQGTASLTDAELVMALCRQDGVSRTLPRLIGDWALWFWNAHNRQLCLARDYAGVRPLHYHLDRDGAVWSPSLDALLEHIKGAWPLDRGYLAGMFFLGPDPAGTPYEGIVSVPPAHAVIIDGDRTRTEPFWSPPFERRLRYRRDSDYEEHFRALFREAVRCRLETDEPAWAFLSGGLDSSSIVCVADDLMARGDARTPALRTITYVFESSATTGERSFIADVERRRGESSHCLDTASYPYLRPRPDMAPAVPYLLDGSVALAQAQKALMDRLGGRVLLCGSGGDELLGNSRRGEAVLADHLRRGEYGAFSRGLRDWSTSLRRPALQVLGQAIASLSGRGLSAFPAGPPPWLAPAFVDLVRDREIVTRTPAHREWPTSLRSVIARTAQQDYASWCGGDVRYPFVDRRLVEFCLSIPLEQLTRPGETRSLMRRALRGIVPERVLTRRSKNVPAQPIGDAVEREWARLARLFSQPLLEQYGLAAAAELAPALRRARHGAEKFLGPLLWAVVLEEWLQQASARRWLRPAPTIDGGVSRTHLRAQATLALERR